MAWELEPAECWVDASIRILKLKNPESWALGKGKGDTQRIKISREKGRGSNIFKLKIKTMNGEMKIAVPVKMNGTIDDHFGHCEFYHVFTISQGTKIVDIQSIKSPQGCGCKSNIAQELREQGVSVMLAGGIGNGAINILNTNYIDVIRGCSGNAIEVVEQYLSGAIRDSGSSCQHHDHDIVCTH